MKRLFQLLKDLVTMPFRYAKHRRQLKAFREFNNMYSGMNRNQRRQLQKKYGLLKPKRGK